MLNNDKSVAMIYDENGNAYDCFDYTPEELERRARMLRGVYVTTYPNPWTWEVNTSC